MAYIISSGEISSGIVLYNDTMTVLDGGTATDTTVNTYSYLEVSSGGTANSTTVNSVGNLIVSDGGAANSVTVNSGGILEIHDVGTVNGATVNSNGSLRIASGATASNIDAVDGAYLRFCVAPNTYIQGTSGGIAFEMKDASISNYSIKSKGFLQVASGGTADGITVNANGSLQIDSGGTATEIKENGGFVDIQGGANVTFVANTFSGLVLSQTSASVHSGTTANSATVNYGGDLIVFSGGTANSATVNDRGIMRISSGGTATEIQENGGFVVVRDGANVTFAANAFSGRILSYNSATVHSGTTANNTTVNYRGALIVFSGGIANSTTVNDGGTLNVSGGIANSTTVSSGGLLDLGSGGTANSTVIRENGSLTVFDKAVAYKTTVSSGGRVSVSGGGTADSATIYANGELNLFGGGSAANAKVYAGGTMKVSSGGKLTGKMNFAFGAVVLVEDGSIVDFDLTQAVPDGKALLNDWSLLQGTPNYTITVDGTQAEGTYLLAENAEDFEETITVTNPPGETLGMLTVGQTAAIGVFNYSLNLANGVLSVTVEESKEITSRTKVISSGQISDGLIVFDEGILHVISGGTANFTTVNTGGSLVVFDGGTANSTTVNDGYFGILVSSGGTANDTAVSSGCLHVYDGGVANNAAFDHEGGCIVHSGGTANGVILSGDDAGFEVWIGGLVNDMIINGGTACLHAVYPEFGDEDKVGGKANNTVIHSGGKLDIDGEGSVADGIIVHSGGWLNVFNIGAMLTGRMTFESGAIITAENGVRLDFNLARTSAGATALVNGLSSIQNAAVFTVTVDDALAYGTYLLADGASGFNKTITVTNPPGETLGMLTVGQTAAIGVFNYSLNLANGVLSLTVEESKEITSRTKVISSGQISDGLIVFDEGILHVISGGSAVNTTVNAGGSLVVFDGCTANSTTVNAGGYLRVSSGGMANDTAVNERGIFHVSSGGVANNAVVNSDARFTVQNGGTANNTIINNQGNNASSNKGLFVSSGGTTFNTTVNSGGYFVVHSGGTATGIVENGGCVNILDGADAAFESNSFSGLVLGSDMRSASVHSGTTAHDVTVNASAYFYIYSGGTATGIVENGGFVGIKSDTNVTFVSNSFSGLILGSDMRSASVHSGTTAHDVTVNTSACLYVYSDGKAYKTNISSGGKIQVLSGGTATEITAAEGAVLYLTLAQGTCITGASAGSAFSFKDCFLSDYQVGSGWINVLSGGRAYDTTVNSGGTMFVKSLGQASDIAVRESGELHVSSGGIATLVRIENGAAAHVGISGTLNDITVAGSGSLEVLSGGMLTGRMTFAEGAGVSMEEGSVLNFNISGFNPSGTALVNDLSLITGEWACTLTVSDAQINGKFVLANGAAGFNRTITVQNTSGDELGTLTVGQKVKIGDADYLLNLNDGKLSVTVSGGSPAPVVDYSFFPGCFAGGNQSLLAKQTDRNVTIYADGEVFGNGLVLDPGWEIAGVGDFNGDGRDDFMRVNDEGYIVGEMTKITGSFTSQVLNFLNDGWNILGTGNFNGNGADDVLIANPTAASETVGLLGYWESGVTWTLINGYSPEWECIATGDFNADGKCDMLWRNSFEGEGGGTYNAYCTWIVDDPVDWRMVSVANPKEWAFLCSGDFNCDGANDIAMINDAGVVGIWGVSDGWLSSWSILSAVTPEWALAGVGDFNGDGTDDIAWCNTETGLAGYWQINDKQLTAWQNIATIA